MTPSGSGAVAHVIAPSPSGGAESVVVALATAAADVSSVAVLNQTAAPADPPHPIAEQLRRRGVVVEEVRCGRRRYRAEAQQLATLLRRWRSTIVHTHGYHGTWVGYQAAQHAGIPAVATVHGYLTRSLKERFYNVLDRRLLRRFDAVIAVSEGIREQLIASGIPATRVHFVQNGFAPAAAMSREDARALLGLRDDLKVAGWVGRLSPEKGPDLFIRALAQTDPAVHAVVVGDGPEMPRMVALADTLGVSRDRVRFAGQLPDAARLLRAFDVLALTSRIEGTPMVILEAVNAGVPVVAYSVGGIPGLLSPDCAWLVPPADVKAFALALEEALGAASTGPVRAARAREQLMDRLSVEQWLRRVREVYGGIKDHAIVTRP